MKKNTIGMLATILVVFISGLTGFFVPFVGVMSALMSYLPSTYMPVAYLQGAALTGANSITAANFALANGCCVCIPIPLVFGVYALSRRANASALEGPLSQPDADI